MVFIYRRRIPRQTKGLGRKDAKLIALSVDLSVARAWSEKLQEVLNAHRELQRWIPQETTDDLIDSMPRLPLRKLVERLRAIGRLNDRETRALDHLDLDLHSMFMQINQEILEAEIMDQKVFLESIESKPLSLEQTKAVITFDNRVLLVAAAGSGKTSVMVARAAYATMKKFIPPSRILLLAFNKAAAEELQERVKKRFESANIDPNGIKASTFHAFGLDVLGRSLKERPTVASWVDNGTDLEEIARIVEELKNSSEEFKYKWDLYRFIFTPETLKASGVDPDAWDKELRERGFRTFDGKVVRSHGERMISNWLYLHGVSYDYERDYKVKTTDEFRRQYMPDFYYPNIDLWHEHWALDLEGNPPSSFPGYVKDMNWKRDLHQMHKTELIETTFGEVVFANGLTRLKEQLVSRGVSMNWDAERPKADFTNIENAEVIGLMRTFMTHVKSNSLSELDIRNRLDRRWKQLKSDRTDLFLELYWLIHNEWERRLSLANAIDFEDMLVQAAKHIENGNYLPGYDLILVDEFQDSSAARSRLVKSLLREKGKYVLAVGDDWQSINRFAGADVSLMTHFHETFGPGPTLHLTHTYRCTQTIADAATQFVTKNPEQIKKSVLASQDSLRSPLLLIRTTDAQQGVGEALHRIAKDVNASDKLTPTVFILGRYGFNRDWIPEKNFPSLKISYRTIHGSKGLESDYVVVVNFEAGLHGFPSEIEDDPVLNLAMSEPETFEHAEERRLLYVALTRAKRQVFLVTRKDKDSMFAVEMMSENLVEVVKVDTSAMKNTLVKTCTECNKGVMVIRRGPYSNFLGCSRFPKCAHKINIR